MKYFLVLITLFSSVNAQDISYTKNSIHAFLPKNNRIGLDVGFSLINDTLDVLNVKEKEFGGSGEDLDALGDMNGYELGVSYSFYDDYYVNFHFNQQHIDYSGATLVNNNIELYLRYQIYQNENFAFAIDGGYVLNKADDLYIYDINTLNQNMKRFEGSAGVNIANDGKSVSYLNDGVTKTAPLTLTPYFATLNTKDQSLYYRGVFSYKSDSLLVDFFAGYKQIKINYTIDSSIAHESALASDIGSNAAFSSVEREDGMIFSGFSLRKNIGSLTGEFSYKYNKMLRLGYLEETDSNHVVNINFLYAVEKNFALYMGGTLMSNQFNGEINYLYTRYSKTTFDHIYGYANIGIIVNF